MSILNEFGRSLFSGDISVAATNDIPGSTSTSFGKIIDTVRNTGSDVYGSVARLGNQIVAGGLPINQSRPVNSQNVISRQVGQPLGDGVDWRLKLGFPARSSLLSYYSNALLAPLMATNGIVFPYTPQVTINHVADWSGTRLTHSNYTPAFYHGSEVQDMNIQSIFTCKNAREASYLLGVITFGKLVTKMFFGQGENVGNPPPILHLNGFGTYHFNNTPVVLKSFQYALPGDVDYIEVETPNAQGTDFYSDRVPAPVGVNNTRIPTELNIMFTVMPVYSRQQVTNFDYAKFANGDLILKGFI